MIRPLPPFVLAVAACVVSTGARADDKSDCAEAYEKAQTLRDSHQLLRARETLQVCARSACTKFIAKDCAAWLVDTESRMPSIVLSAKDERGTELSTVSVSMDGAPLANQLDGQAIDVDPGRHTLTFVLADGRKIDLPYTVLEGEKAQRVGITAPARASAATAPANPGPTPVAPIRAVDSPSSSWTGRKTLAAALAATGLVGIGVGAVFGLAAISSKSSQEASCHGNTPAECPNPNEAMQAHDRAVSAGTISTTAFVAGGALAALGVVLFVAAPSGNDHGATAPSAALVVAPAPGAGGAGVSLRATF